MTLTGADDDKVKLAFVETAINDLLQNADTTQGIEVTFTNSAKYSSLVAMFDMCARRDVKSYINYKNKFWIFNHHRHQRRKPLTYY